jgi:hypothetical protein
MALTKQTIIDKIESVRVQEHYVLQVREAIQVLEAGNVISRNYHRSTLAPDHDVSAITDDVVKAQFNAVMTDEIKANYAKFLKEQAEQNKAS